MRKLTGTRKKIVIFFMAMIILLLFSQVIMHWSLASEPVLEQVLEQEIIEDDDEHDMFVFPSVEERVSYYMGSYWAKESNVVLGKNLPPNIQCSPDAYKLGSQAVLLADDMLNMPGIVHGYFHKLYPLIDALNNNDDKFDHFSLLVQLGDHPLHPGTDSLPVVIKSRYARPNSGLEPIILPFDFMGHYGKVFKLKGKMDIVSTPWSKKIDTISWRGLTMGPHGCFQKGKSTLGDCDRLQLVRKYHNVTKLGSASVDIGFSELGGVSPDLTGEMESYVKEKYNIKSMLRHKYLISVQGNDVDPDLKWKLYSDSVVFMKVPTKISWAMEEKLVPFFHYVPLADDFSDLSEKLEWANEHQEECKKIAHRSTKYMEALVASDQAAIDQDQIVKSIFKSYQGRFGNFLYENCKKQRLKSWDKATKNVSFTFPSAVDRITYYMGSHWMKESISATGQELLPTIECSPDPYKPGSQAILQMDDVLSRPGIVRNYFQKLYPFLRVLKDHDKIDNFALLVQLGDNPLHTGTESLPVVIKSRYASGSPFSGEETPILLPFDFEGHYGKVMQLKENMNNITTRWKDKLNTISWRGGTNGPHGCFLFGKSNNGKCDRLQLVRKYNNITKLGSISVDIGFSELIDVSPDLLKEVGTYVKSSYDMGSMLRHKYLISVEGNDVDPDLKWKLYSNSVVFMKPPSRVTWAMEDKLVPFYHYIPLAGDYSDLWEKVDWADKHPAECRKIIRHSTRYIEDLVTSDRATKDQHLILMSIFKSYQIHFGHCLYDNCKKRRSKTLLNNNDPKNASVSILSLNWVGEITESHLNEFHRVECKDPASF